MNLDKGIEIYELIKLDFTFKRHLFDTLKLDIYSNEHNIEAVELIKSILKSSNSFFI